MNRKGGREKRRSCELRHGNARPKASAERGLNEMSLELGSTPNAPFSLLKLSVQDLRSEVSRRLSDICPE
jgi:hypothetical protein